jgi:hypothetical protein
MRILQFPKERWTGAPYPMIEERKEVDEFEKELQLTRENEGLMTLLEKRAKAIASVSLDEIKKRIAVI